MPALPRPGQRPTKPIKLNEEKFKVTEPSPRDNCIDRYASLKKWSNLIVVSPYIAFFIFQTKSIVIYVKPKKISASKYAFLSKKS